MDFTELELSGRAMMLTGALGFLVILILIIFVVKRCADNKKAQNLLLLTIRKALIIVKFKVSDKKCFDKNDTIIDLIKLIVNLMVEKH